MTHAEKIEAMYSHVKNLGISRSIAAPPLWRMLWWIGIEVPPPLFMGFTANALLTGTHFGVCWGGLMMLVNLFRHDFSPSVLFFAAIGAGVLFGSSMAANWRYIARKHHLPSWEQVPGE